MKKGLWVRVILTFLILFLFSFGYEIKVAAAANLKAVFPKIVAEYKKLHPDANIQVVYASSGALELQIKRGVKYDIYLSANKYFPDELHKIFKNNNPKLYAKGMLTLVSYKKIDYKQVRDLLLNSKCIVIANPSTAPYGKAAMEAINNLWILSYIQSKIVYAKNVSTVVGYLKKCDVGIISKSLSLKLKNKNLHFLDLPLDSYYPIEQSAILLSGKKEAKEFFDFIFSKTAKKLFKKYGYLE